VARKFVPIILSTILIALGLPIAILGYERAFNFVSCPSEALTCMNVYTWSNSALLIGSVAVLLGAIVLARKSLVSRA